MSLFSPVGEHHSNIDQLLKKHTKMKSSFLEQRKSLTNGFDTSTMTSMVPLPESLKANSLMGDYHRSFPAKESLKINADSIPSSKDSRASADDSRAATLHAIKERLMLSKSKVPLQLDANELPKKQIENFPSIESSVFLILQKKHGCFLLDPFSKNQKLN